MNQLEGKTIQMYICYELTNIRISKELKKREVASALDIDTGTLFDIEKGANPNVPLFVYMQLCDLYNIELVQVIHGAKKNLAIDRGYPSKS